MTYFGTCRHTERSTIPSTAMVQTPPNTAQPYGLRNSTRTSGVKEPAINKYTES